jgi:capsular exopolysaccharide synthesis family protein
MSASPDGNMIRALDQGLAEPLSYEFSPDLVTLVADKAYEAEAIRTIRTHIIARHMRDGRRGLAVCAATPKVGCSFTAANLAVSMAQVGVSTLLVDGNLRDPQLEEFIRPPSLADGLRQCVANEGLPNSYLHSEVIPNLSVLFSGGVAPNAQELLGSAPFRTMIESCLRDFEITIIDTPPLSQCADALRIASMMGYTLVVARTNVSKSKDLAVLAQQLQEDGARVVGTVLNEV